MIRNQLGRRNLPNYERARLALQLKPLLAEEAKKRQGERNDLKDIQQKSDGSEVRDELAKIAGVGKETVKRAEQFANGLDALHNSPECHGTDEPSQDSNLYQPLRNGI